MAKPAHHMLDIYGAEVWITTTLKRWVAVTKPIGLADDKPEAAGRADFATFHPDGGGLTVPHIVVWIDKAAHKTQAELVNTIAHEASHAAGQLLDYLGHQPAPTDEPQAYLVGWLAERIWEACA